MTATRPGQRPSALPVAAGWTYRRRQTAESVGPGQELTTLAVALEARSIGHGVEAAYLASAGTPRCTGAAALREALGVALPQHRRCALVVEAGSVETAFVLAGADRHLEQCSYVLATCGAVLVMLARRGDRALLRHPAAVLMTRWTDGRPAGTPRATDPVVLGPSALLALVLSTRAPGVSSAAELSTDETPRSPYPPHDYSFEERFGLAPVDGPFRTLSRLERALQPLGALEDDGASGLRIDVAPAVPWPERAIVLDALVALDGPGPGATAWEVEYTLHNRYGSASAAAPLRVRADPAELLAQLRGALGPSEPALHRDPIAGDRYATAPPGLTTLVAADLPISA